MNDVRLMNRTEEDALCDRAELTSAVEVLRAMLKTSKAFRIYSPNNPLRQKFIDESTEKTTAHLQRYGQCQFDLEQFSTFYQGTRIHESRDPKESMAFRMYSDGIRSIHFSEGIQAKEICDFLDIVGQDRSADTDDDIVTLLWMMDFSHIAYFLADDFLELDTETGALSKAASQREGIRKVYEAPEEPAKQQPMPQNIQPLTAEEAATLKRETAAEQSADPVQEVLKILASILAGETDLDLFREFLVIVDNLIANLCHAGRVGDALRLVRYLRKMGAAESVVSGKKELVRAGGGGNVPADAILALQRPIDSADDLSPDDLLDLFRYFGPAHIASLCELLGNIQQMKMRKATISALVEIGRGAPRAFYPFLQDHRWYLVRNIVLILTLIGDGKCLGAVIPLAGHPDPRVRKEVLSYLLKHPDPRAREAMMGFLNDESAPLRIRTLQVLSAANFAPALEWVEAMIREKDFAERPLQEKCALYEALGALGGERVVPRLQQMVMRRNWLNRSKESEDIACAVAGLKKVRTPTALEALRKAQEKRKGSELEALISKALKELETESGVSLAVEEEHE